MAVMRGIQVALPPYHTNSPVSYRFHFANNSWGLRAPHWRLGGQAKSLSCGRDGGMEQWLFSTRSSRGQAGLRRGEILGLRWSDIDLATGTITVVQSLEQTKEGVRLKSPKTHRGRRSIVLPAITVEALRSHRAKQAKERLALGPAYHDHDLVCPRPGGAPWPPDMFSTAFAVVVRRSRMHPFRFHDLRHSHASQLLKQAFTQRLLPRPCRYWHYARYIFSCLAWTPGGCRTAVKRGVGIGNSEN